MNNVRILLTGDCSLSVEFGNEISEAVNRRVRSFRAALENAAIPGITETVPTYRSLMVHYDPAVIRYDPLRDELEKLLGDSGDAPVPPGLVLEIPVLYGGEAGPDLPFVAEHAGISEDQVVRIHSSAEYLIYMLGFIQRFSVLKIRHVLGGTAGCQQTSSNYSQEQKNMVLFHMMMIICLQVKIIREGHPVSAERLT